jgi:hypothetical protein
MALVVEDGSGKATAESYCSVFFADDYHLARGRDESWAQLDDDLKEQYLRAASDYMLQEYRMRWAGYRKTSTQALDWPRYAVPMRDAPSGAYFAYYDSDTVPDEVKRACAELAFRAKDGTLTQDLGAQVESKTVGPITVKYAPWARETKVYQAIEGMLRPMFKGAGQSAAVVVRR